MFEVSGLGGCVPSAWPLPSGELDDSVVPMVAPTIGRWVFLQVGADSGRSQTGWMPSSRSGRPGRYRKHQ